ncbi:hypothetical protein [Bacteroides reticulotermitis]|uniref:Uncharacterized protein n=1 Tax=Bacteroides reticulotermitis TaxID=1133319 RepID=A0A840D2M8_9BACE|nr:hypothetical protein [Bacteroides reticulotermitis]MBB4043814.1 hypothetical protein [Bacteroides reticulotermitis]
MANNTQVLNRGFKKAQQIANDYIANQLIKVCEMLVDDAVKRYKSPVGPFTGNTITGYACGVYLNGTLFYYYKNDGIKSPLRGKLKKGESVSLAPDYGGRTRSMTGRINTDGEYGHEHSFKFLRAYNSKVKSGVEIVMCSGTEYSTYIETVLDGNVLTDTFRNAKQILANNIKPMN